MRVPRNLLIILSIAAFSLTACNSKGGSEPIDRGVIIAEKAQVSSSTALVTTPLTELKRGDEVDILEHRSVNQREYTRVRVVGDKPLEGWMDTYVVISKRIVDECQKLADEWKDISTQASGKTKDKLKLRLKPGRDSDVAFLLPAATKVEVLGRVRTERRASDSDSESKSTDQSAEPVKYDNWYKVRLGPDYLIKAGWIYADSIELSPPDQIAGLPGAGRRFVAWQPFGKVLDTETKNEEINYIILDKYAYSKDEDIDFDRIYVVAWDTNKHGYGSIHIESQLRGLYPLKLTPKDGGYIFTVQLLDKNKAAVPANYAIKQSPKTNQWDVERIKEQPKKKK
jgi:hypothetical protein